MLSAPLAGGHCVIAAADCSLQHGMTGGVTNRTELQSVFDTAVEDEYGLSETVCPISHEAFEYEVPTIDDERCKTGNTYLAPHFTHAERRPSSRCFGCDEPVPPTGRYADADNKEWHGTCYKTYESLNRRWTQSLRSNSTFSDTVSLPSLISSPRWSSPCSTPDYVSFYSADSPSSGSAKLSLSDFCQDVRTNFGGDEGALLSTLFWHKETAGVRHEFLVAQICQLGRNDVWIRLERGAKRNRGALRRLQIASSSNCPADDTVKVSSCKDTLVGDEKSSVEAKLVFKDALPLIDLEKLLSIFASECPEYNLLGQNCYYFCSVIADLLMQRFKASLEGHIKYKNMSSSIRLRIRQRWTQSTQAAC